MDWRKKGEEERDDEHEGGGYTFHVDSPLIYMPSCLFQLALLPGILVSRLSVDHGATLLTSALTNSHDIEKIFSVHMICSQFPMLSYALSLGNLSETLLPWSPSCRQGCDNTFKKMPAKTTLAVAELTAVERAPPKDKLTIAPFGQVRVFASLATKLIPAMVPELSPNFS
jgi:hypothetical protein